MSTYQLNRMTIVYVIIPVYKAERYLHRCLESVLNQTYKNLWIILIDDGSPDNCPTICDEYKSKYNNVIVIHQENSGQSCARNAGLIWLENLGLSDNSNVYIGFVDSDDWIAPDMYEILVKLVEENNAEVGQVNYATVSSEKTTVRQTRPSKKVIEGKEILQYYATTSTITGSYSVWQCLFKASILKKLRFRPGKINEDIDFKYKALSNCHRFAVTDLKKYYYWNSSESTTRDGLKSRDYDLYDAADELCKLTENETYGTIRKLAEVKRARTAFSLLSKIAYYGIADKNIDRHETINELTKEHRKNLRKLLDSPLPVSRKLLSIGFAISFKWTERCIRFAKFCR